MDSENAAEVKKPVLSVRIEQDTNEENPFQAWDQAGKTAFYHRRYEIGDKKQEFKTPEDFKEFMESKEGKKAVMLPVYLLDHSGLSVRTGSFHDPWDSGQLGYIYMKDADRKKEKMTRKQAYTCLESEIRTLDQYLRGEVYGIIIEDQNGQQYDSCWGFYGYDYAKREAASMLKACQEAVEKEYGTQLALIA